MQRKTSRTAGDPTERASLGRLAHLLDTAIPLPGGIRIGLDGLIGLIPGVGDLIGTLLSSYIVAQAHRLGASRMVLAHMAANIALETVVGVIPVIGDLFDFAWKANNRNVALLERQIAEPRETQRRSTTFVVGLIAGLVVLAFGVMYLAVALVQWLWTAVS